uniref:Uncharacterized protein n=1 Tax=Arundo donax TaxID=35708 RepID=A0A0A8Y1D7_ARUDO
MQISWHQLNPQSLFRILYFFFLYFSIHYTC